MGILLIIQEYKLSPLPHLRDVKGLSIMIEGSPFLANPTSLPFDGLDVILGMNWLTQHR
jgi:hypothetical protein